MGKQDKKVSAVSELGFEALFPPGGGHPVAAAIAQVEEGLAALRRALMDEAQDRAGGLAHELRARVLEAESAVERVISHVPAIGPALAMGLYRATHKDDAEGDASVRPSNADDMASHAQLEPGGVASSEYLAHVGLA